MTFQFKIQLKNIAKPPVWRTVTVPSQFDFSRFHSVIQTAFGWENYHMFQFSPGGYGSSPTIKELYEDIEEYEDDKAIEASETQLSEIFNSVGQTFTYTYDFGDDWNHKITLEKITEEGASIADCIAGKGKCPPEDCGGPWGYANLLGIINDPKNPEYGGMREWLGLDDDEKWDVNDFNLQDASMMVRIV